MTGTTLKELAKRRSDVFWIDPREINIKSGWNARDLNAPDNKSHVEALATSIATIGVQEPLTVFRDEGRVWLSDGHCRMAAIALAMKNGAQIDLVPVKTEGRGSNEADYVLRQLLDGKPKTAFESGLIYKRLLGYGWTVQKIAEQTGKSASAINASLDLQGAPVEVQKEVASGRISASLAAKIVRTSDSPSDAKKAVGDAIDHATQAGRGKATARDVGSEPKVSRVNKLAYIGEIIERADIEDGGPGYTRVTMKDSDWSALQKALNI